MFIYINILSYFQMIPRGEELLCWYKDEKKSSKGESSSVKFEGAKNGCTDSGSMKLTDNSDSRKSHESKCYEGNVDTASKVISLTTDESFPKSGVVQGACIRLSGLTDSIQRMISSTTQRSDLEIRSREPVVRLVPLSAEIKLKVHLDLDIHLDSELKNKCESKTDESKCFMLKLYTNTLRYCKWRK